MNLEQLGSELGRAEGAADELSLLVQALAKDLRSARELVERAVGELAAPTGGMWGKGVAARGSGARVGSGGAGLHPRGGGVGLDEGWEGGEGGGGAGCTHRRYVCSLNVGKAGASASIEICWGRAEAGKGVEARSESGLAGGDSMWGHAGTVQVFGGARQIT